MTEAEQGSFASAIRGVFQARPHFWKIERRTMKIVVIGGSGLIGKKLVQLLHDKGHDVLAASPSSGVNTITGEGLDKALAGAQVVVDVANSPSFEDKAVLEFFETSGKNLAAAEKSAGVKHHVALSVVGADRLPDSGYMRAKVAQEKLIRASGIPFTIVRATQFFEFIGGIAESGLQDGKFRLPTAKFQPIAAGDVSAALADIAVAAPANGMLELAGPEPIPMCELVRRYLALKHDTRPVVGEADAKYFGAKIDDRSLTPGERPRVGPTSLERWLSNLSQ
jgi:uncharacterized protein YbjT (DUF2867 family)